MSAIGSVLDDVKTEGAAYLDFDPPCSFAYHATPDDKCGKPAEWAQRVKCCGNVYFHCDDHKDGVSDAEWVGGMHCHCGMYWDDWKNAIGYRWRLK